MKTADKSVYTAAAYKIYTSFAAIFLDCKIYIAKKHGGFDNSRMKI
jgi:hypothetical protein